MFGHLHPSLLRIGLELREAVLEVSRIKNLEITLTTKQHGQYHAYLQRFRKDLVGGVKPLHKLYLLERVVLNLPIDAEDLSGLYSDEAEVS